MCSSSSSELTSRRFDVVAHMMDENDNGSFRKTAAFCPCTEDQENTQQARCCASESRPHACTSASALTMKGCRARAA